MAHTKSSATHLVYLNSNRKWIPFSQAQNIARNLIPFHSLGLHVKTGAFWAKMINSKNFHFFLKFMMVAFFRLWSPKWSPHNCQYLGGQPQNLKNPCFSNLQVWISFKTSFSSFGLNKMTHGQISTYINGAFFGAPGVLQPKIPSKFE